MYTLNLRYLKVLKLPLTPMKNALLLTMTKTIASTKTEPKKLLCKRKPSQSMNSITYQVKLKFIFCYYFGWFVKCWWFGYG